MKELDKSNPPEAAWLSAVEAHEARGLSRQAAARQVDREQPSLRLEMVAAYNARVANKGEEEAEPVAKVAEYEAALPNATAAELLRFMKQGIAPAEAAFEVAVAGLVAKGVSKQQATGRVIAAQPELHAQYLAAYNARVRGRRAV